MCIPKVIASCNVAYKVIYIQRGKETAEFVTKRWCICSENYIWMRIKISSQCTVRAHYEVLTSKVGLPMCTPWGQKYSKYTVCDSPPSTQSRKQTNHISFVLYHKEAVCNKFLEAWFSCERSKRHVPIQGAISSCKNHRHLLSFRSGVCLTSQQKTLLHRM